MMQQLSPYEISRYLKAGQTFSAQCDNGAFTIVIEKYVPYVCVAVHNGHALPKTLAEKCALTEEERRYEEDPFTGAFIETFPIRLIAHDSRYYYDLNRAQIECVYTKAWGKDVWKTPLTHEEDAEARERHASFYSVFYGVLLKLRQRFGGAVVYDIHSYNYKREGVPKNAPLFNVGTSEIDKEKYGTSIRHWCKELEKVRIPNIETRVAENEVFEGKGFIAIFVREWCENMLALPTEIKKVYMEEETGTPFPEVIATLSGEMKRAILNNAHLFISRQTRLSVKQKYRLLSSLLDTALVRVDRALFKLLKGFEILVYVNPMNLEGEKRKFLANQRTYTPAFRYRPLHIDPYEVKRALYTLPVDEIADVTMKRVYADIIESYAREIDLLATRGTREFLYNSLKQYGEPSERDIANAHYLIHTAETPDPEPECVSADEAKTLLEEAIEDYGFPFRVEMGKNLAAKVMVINGKRVVKLRKGSVFTKTEVTALCHHEVGVHVLTSVNAAREPLSFLMLGLPGNTESQEGLAILSEYCAGALTVRRLKNLAFRVIAVEMMLKGASFSDVFRYLVDEHAYTDDDAFYLTARVFRGGGFTKDHLYLKGFKALYDVLQQGKSLAPLFVGKTSIAYYEALQELIVRDFIVPPAHIPRVITNPLLSPSILDYIITSLH